MYYNAVDGDGVWASDPLPPSTFDVLVSMDAGTSVGSGPVEVVMGTYAYVQAWTRRQLERGPRTSVQGSAQATVGGP